MSISFVMWPVVLSFDESQSNNLFEDYSYKIFLFNKKFRLHEFFFEVALHTIAQRLRGDRDL